MWLPLNFWEMACHLQSIRGNYFLLCDNAKIATGKEDCWRGWYKISFLIIEHPPHLDLFGNKKKNICVNFAHYSLSGAVAALISLVLYCKLSLALLITGHFLFKLLVSLVLRKFTISHSVLAKFFISHLICTIRPKLLLTSYWTNIQCFFLYIYIFISIFVMASCILYAHKCILKYIR